VNDRLAHPIDTADGALSLAGGGRSVVVFVSGSGLHAFENPGYAFERADGGSFRADGTVWDPAAGRGDDGRRLDRIPIRRLFAFTWQDDHGPNAF
jgi:hypothetical protein